MVLVCSHFSLQIAQSKKKKKSLCLPYLLRVCCLIILCDQKFSWILHKHRPTQNLKITLLLLFVFFFKGNKLKLNTLWS